MRPGLMLTLLAFPFLAVLLTANTAYADGIVSPAPGKAHDRLVNVVGPQGLITQLRVVDPAMLAGELEAMRSDLIARKQELLREVDEKQLDSGDALVTVLMPGGLLYAGYRKAVLERAKQDLARVSEEISEYSHDLAVIAGRAAPVTVALH